jgi:hypothetical protein
VEVEVAAGVEAVQAVAAEVEVQQQEAGAARQLEGW